MDDIYHNYITLDFLENLSRNDFIYRSLYINIFNFRSVDLTDTIKKLIKFYFFNQFYLVIHVLLMKT